MDPDRTLQLAKVAYRALYTLDNSSCTREEITSKFGLDPSVPVGHQLEILGLYTAAEALWFDDVVPEPVCVP